MAEDMMSQEAALADGGAAREAGHKRSFGERVSSGSLFAFFALIYTLTCQARVNSYDGQRMYLTAQSLVERGSLALPDGIGVVGRGGLVYAKYGIGQSLVEIPLYLVGKALGFLAHSKGAQVTEAVTMLTNPLLMAACCAVAFATFLELGYPRATAVRATLVLGLATAFWPYSKTDFSEPLLALCFAMATLYTLRGARLSQAGRTASLGGAAAQYRCDLVVGLALGGAILAKYIAVLVVPIFLVAMLLLAAPAIGRAEQRGVWIRAMVRRATVVVIPVVVAGGVVLLVNDLRFGSPLSTGYSAGDRPLTYPLLLGLAGQILSTRAGLLFYNPICFVGLCALPLLVWRRPREALLPAALVLATLLIYGTYWSWDGNSAWGARYLVPILPYLLWPLLALGAFGAIGGRERLLPATWRPVASVGALARGARSIPRVGMALLVALSVIPQVLGVVVNYLIFDMYWTDASVVPLFSLGVNRLVHALWVLPLVVQFAFTGALPAAGFASADYPFGPPFPSNPNMPAALGKYYAQSFWFTLVPHPLIVCVAGAAVLGIAILFVARPIVRLALSDARLESGHADRVQSPLSVLAGEAPLTLSPEALADR